VNYIRVITGHAPDEWRTVQTSAADLNLPIAVSCPQIVKQFSATRISCDGGLDASREPETLPQLVRELGVIAC